VIIIDFRPPAASAVKVHSVSESNDFVWSGCHLSCFLNVFTRLSDMSMNIYIVVSVVFHCWARTLLSGFLGSLNPFTAVMSLENDC